MSPEASARVVIPRLVAALVLFFAVAVASTYPLIWRLGTTLPGPGFGDNITSLWNVWWFRYALQHGQSPYWTPMLFAPFGTQLVLKTLAVPFKPIGAQYDRGWIIHRRQYCIPLRSEILGAELIHPIRDRFTNCTRRRIGFKFYVDLL